MVDIGEVAIASCIEGFLDYCMLIKERITRFGKAIFYFEILYILKFPLIEACVCARHLLCIT